MGRLGLLACFRRMSQSAAWGGCFKRVLVKAFGFHFSLIAEGRSEFDNVPDFKAAIVRERCCHAARSPLGPGSARNLCPRHGWVQLLAAQLPSLQWQQGGVGGSCLRRNAKCCQDVSMLAFKL